MTRPAVMVFVVAACAASSVLTAGCDDKKDQAKLAPSASALAPAVAPPTAKVMKFAIDPASETTLTLEAPQEKIKGKTTGAAGTLDIDMSNLEASRGEVKVDLTTLVLAHFGDERDKAQTTHARTWLEVGDGEDGKLDEKLKEQHRYAVYAVREVAAPSANDVTKVAPAKDGADEVRVVTLTTKGELLVHGRKVDREAELELTFRYDAGAAPDKPKALHVKSKAPLRVVLAEHDVKPRDGLGKIAKESFKLLGTKVADTAEISLDFRAKPSS